MEQKSSTGSKAITVKQYDKYMMCKDCLLKPSCSNFCFKKDKYDYMSWFLENTVCPHCGHFKFYISEHDKMTHNFVCTDCKTGFLCTYHQVPNGPAWKMKLAMTITSKYADLTRIAFHEFLTTIFGWEIGLRLERRIRDD